MASESATVSVESVDALTEYKVYKQFGYHQKAAESLALYLKNNKLSLAATKPLVTELATLWLQAKQMDALADVITQYRDALDKSDAEQLIKDGLVVENNHLGLRVLAEELLGWGVKEAAQELGLDRDEISGGAAHGKPMAAAKAAVADVGKNKPAADVQRHLLVHGDVGSWQINQDERDVLLGMTKAEYGYRLLKDQLVYDAAIRTLNKAIRQSEKPASLIIDALSLDYRNNKLTVFAQHLWRLYYSLGQYGGRVKERMLGWGYNLGSHSMFDELAANPSEQRLREIGLSQGYITRGSSAIKAKRRALVDSVANQDSVAETPTERILRDAESLLTYGQLEHSMELLETSILEHPQESQLYIALFDLYERAEDWPRLEKMLHQIRDTVKTPPEEVVLAMSQLLQRIHHGGVQH
ncbi:hypothetical protein JQU52_02710 [Paralysiella testudinis]|uniref:Uncharacterized protein n=1 Tax=Paralysiella testudinis TaxID=2809020 RepID=A0A892ZLH6_9NEIS|nr:hypothetical protein JQU52_02710 [Paralysiella testudinis]